MSSQKAVSGGVIEAKLKELGIELPEAVTPAAAAYVPYTVSQNTVFISGQLPLVNGKVEHKGAVGAEFTVDEAKKVARICGLNVVAQLKAAVGGDLDRVKRIVKLVIFVNSAPGVSEQHLVANGASELIVEIFGEKGKHARSAIGVAGLPLGVPVEVEAFVEIA